MEKRFDRLEDKMDSIDTRIDSIDKTLAVNTELLAQHIKRTNLLETKVEHLEKDAYKAMGIIKFLPWIIGLIAAVVSILAAIL